MDPALAATVSIKYSQMVEDVQSGRFSSILISPDRGTAVLRGFDGNNYLVNLAPDKNLLKLLRDHRLDIAVKRSVNPSRARQALSSLVFPVFLLVLLFPIFIATAVVYCIPSLIAFRRGHRYRWIIIVLNLVGVLGGVTWIIALVWAVWPVDSSLNELLSNPTGLKK